MGKFFKSKTILKVLITSIFSTLACAGIIYAASTIGANISTTGDLTVDTNTLYVDSTNNRVGVATTTPQHELDVYGNFNFQSISPPGALTSANTGASGNISQLSCSYYVTFITSVGETEGGDLSDNLLGCGPQVALTDIPTGPSDVTARKIYRLSSDLGYKLVTTISDNTTTTYTDNIADASLGGHVPRKNTTGGIFYNNNNQAAVLNSSVTALGINSGLNNSGLYNTFLGINTGLSTVGSYNSFIGYNAGSSNTTGYNNIALGSDALRDNVSGGYNIAIGDGALRKNIDGSANIAIGLSALNGVTADATSTDYNIGIGFYSLLYTATGTSNTAIGHEAMMYNVGGSNNTALGYYAGHAGVEERTIDNNTFIGYSSGANTIGDNNVFLGYNTGYANYNGSNNLFLGYQAGYNEAGSNKLYITNSNTVASSSLIYGEFDNNLLSFNAKIGVGTSTPATKLEVHDTATSTVSVISETAGSGGRIILEDSDGAGCSEIYILDGVISSATVACPSN